MYDSSTAPAQLEVTMENAISLPLSSSEFLPAICGPASLPLIEDDELVAMLEGAAESELDGLVQTLIEKGGLTCQLSCLSAFRGNQPRHRAYARDIAAEIQKFGANTLASQIFRSGRGVTYGEIVGDVASKLGLGRGKNVLANEAAIVEKLMGDMWRQLTPAQRADLLREFKVRDYSAIPKSVVPVALIEATRASGFAAYKMSVIIANAAAHVILGHGLSFVTNAAITKSLSVALGPPGWCFAALIAAQGIASEAYRVTVPCVLQVSMIRLASLEREKIRRRQKTKWILKVATIASLILLTLIALVWLIASR